jgi:large subunit ribosomal protein L18e
MSTQNPQRSGLIATLKSVGREAEGGVWLDVAERLDKPRRTHAEVNLGRIERYAREDELVVVPGKVLGSGVIETPVTIAAADFSGTAETKIEQAGGEVIGLEAAADRNPDGSDTRVIR